MALVAAAMLTWASGAVAQSPTPPVLRIAIADTGRAVFDQFVPELTGLSGLATPPVVTHASALEVLRDFCQGVGGNNPDVVLTTRRLRLSLAGQCSKNGVEHMVQVKLGRGALILAVRRGSDIKGLTARDVYLALARDIPDKDEFRRNTNIRWSDIDASLPQEDIRFQLPPREDGGRARFNSLILEGGCREEPQIKLIFAADQRTARCVTTRVDRVREIPPDQAVRALLDAPVGTIGVLSLDDLAQASGDLVPLALDGVLPTAKTVLDGSYDYASVYWLYAKRGQALRGRPAEIDTAVDRIVSGSLSESVLGLNGPLSMLGVIPLPADDRRAQRAVFAANPNTYSLGPLFEWVGYAAGAAQGLAELALGDAEAADTPDGLDFAKLMDIAGYTTEEFQTSVGLFPGAGMTFGIVREMSESDQDYLERRLVQDAHLRPGPLPGLQRKIVRSVLDVSEADNYEISQVVIELLPLPSFKLVVTPKDAPMSQDTTSILRAIERLGNRVNEMTQ
jgi:phosphate transport system substrate-binding protein